MKFFLGVFLFKILLSPSALMAEQSSSREGFDSIIEKIVALYQEDLLAIDRNFFIKKDWKSSNLNSEAKELYSTKEGRRFGFHFHGGIYRHSKMNARSFALLVCHEIGHFLAGPPYKREFRSGVDTWSSAEGQADLFAISCFKDAVARGLLVDDYKVKPHPFDNEIQRLCLKEEKRQACLMTLRASYDLSLFFWERRAVHGWKQGPEPNFSFEDIEPVKVTLRSHPDPKCRLATYVAETIENQNLGDLLRCWKDR